MLDAASLAIVFLAYTGLVAAIVAAMCLRAFRGVSGALALAILALWLTDAGAFSWFGLLRDPNLRPPGMVLLVGPVFAALILVVKSPAGRRLAETLSIPLLIGFQLFRVGPEFTIAELNQQGLAPKLLTLAGGNFELLVALSAPVVAWISTRGINGRRAAVAWNVLGILSLFNVAARSVLTAPGPLNLIHAEISNVAFGNFPFGLIPGFMAPLAVVVHWLALRALRRSANNGSGSSAHGAI